MADETKVLVIEDEPETQRLLAAQLEAHGYRAEVAVDANSGLEAARKHRPAAVLLDIGLPGRDGYRVLERLYDMPGLADIPVVVMTGRRPDGPMDWAFPDLGAQELVRVVDEALRRAA
jgi:CheY-like chemotaxis protein